MSRNQTLVQGSELDECVLRILARAPASGHAVAKRLAAQHASHPSVACTTYLGLHRLERQGLVTSEWRPVAGRQLTAKYYRLTAIGLRSCSHSSVDRGPVSGIGQVTMLLVMTILGTGNTVAAREPSRQPHLTILIDGRVPISANELFRARMDVIRIFSAIGVNTAWIHDKPSEDSASPGPTRRAWTGFVVQVVIVARVVGPSLKNAVSLGVALPRLRDSRAEIIVFHDHIQEFAQAHQKATSSVLALVVAHEIGHALLPSAGHTSTGIM